MEWLTEVRTVIVLGVAGFATTMAFVVGFMRGASDRRDGSRWVFQWEENDEPASGDSCGGCRDAGSEGCKD